MDYKIRVVNSISEVDPAVWDGLANPETAQFDPFLSHGFLHAMEASEAASKETGWVPLHMIVEDSTDTPVAAMPLYAKTHSRGEFVFDYAWADAFERAGGEYYPKLLAAVPFTPVTGRRFLTPRGRENTDEICKVLISGAVQFCEQQGWSSLHINFLTAEEATLAAEMGLSIRHDQQFHWQNKNYADFDGFLADLSSAKRKNLRKERTRAQDGLDFVHLRGADITEQDWDDFYAFYLDTGIRKWGSPYLNRETFRRLHASVGDSILLILAKEAGHTIAGALNFIGSDTLYGRYWGSLSPRKNLHFETCYYQAIDFAIANNLQTVEAGAQGGHKLARGYLPAKTYSAHWVVHDGLRAAVDAYLEEEREHVAEHIDVLGAHTPFKKGE